jgi:hypothetical protein
MRRSIYGAADAGALDSCPMSVYARLSLFRLWWSVIHKRSDRDRIAASHCFADGEGEPNELLHMVLNTISKPGILCTDGSNADPAFKNYFDDLKASPDAHMRLNDFEIVGCRLSPISTLDTRYGQTIAWQVTQ